MAVAMRNLLGTMALAVALAATLPAEAEESAPREEAESCRVPGPGEPAAVRPPRDLSAVWARLAAEGAQARAEGVQPLNTRGYNYQQGRSAGDTAALDFEARER